MANKSIDIQALAPSLLALSELIKLLNRQINGEDSAVKVRVNADLKQNCFELNLEVLQDAWDKITGIFSNEEFASAKNLLEWIGIIATPCIGIFGLIKKLKGKQIESVQQQIIDGKNTTTINITGDNNTINIPSEVYRAYQDASIRRKAVDVLAPLREDGYDSLQFYGADGIYQEFKPEDVPDFESLHALEPQNVSVSKIRAIVKIRKPVYEGNAKWTIIYKKAVDAAFNDTVWLQDYQTNKASAPPQSSLDVDLEERYITNNDGVQIAPSSYTITKVHDVKLPKVQMELPI